LRRLKRRHPGHGALAPKDGQSRGTIEAGDPAQAQPRHQAQIRHTRSGAEGQIITFSSSTWTQRSALITREAHQSSEHTPTKSSVDVPREAPRQTHLLRGIEREALRDHPAPNSVSAGASMDPLDRPALGLQGERRGRRRYGPEGHEAALTAFGSCSSSLAIQSVTGGLAGYLEASTGYLEASIG